MDQQSGPPAKRQRGMKRENYICWDDFFMATALVAAQRSKDPSTQVGACIVNEDKKIVGIGYNSMPYGCSDDEFPWTKKQPDKLQNKSYYVCHAELNAIMNKNSADLKNCTAYVTLFPCNECSKLIIQSGIRKIFYLSDKLAHKIETRASKNMLNAAGIECSKFVPKCGPIELNFRD